MESASVKSAPDFLAEARRGEASSEIGAHFSAIRP